MGSARQTAQPISNKAIKFGPDEIMLVSLPFRFKPTIEKSAQLERLLEDQQDPSSALCHPW